MPLEHDQGGLHEGAKNLWSPEGVLVFEGGFKGGQPHGEHREYFLGGGSKSTVNYENGSLEGKNEEWHANGARRSVGSMQAGKRHGRWRIWNESGELLSSYSGLYEHGKRVGD